MAELTQEHIEQAIAAFMNCAGHAATGELLSMKERMRRAAPFLKFPLDEPNEEELDDVGAGLGMPFSAPIRNAIFKFVRRRNAALQPKPVDPREETIRAVLYKRGVALQTLPSELIAAIDGAK